MIHKATKVIIITEKLLIDNVAKLILAEGASGYTVMAAGGQGSRGMRSSDRASVVDGLSNVKIEVIVADRNKALRIIEAVNERYFGNYSGITYLEEVDVLRPHKF
ncbi:MAG: P-II family nitrogen regulator [Pseudomonadota bacterium]